jgi:thiosulfate/3-mercaptopyruvate sulfurtransferase
VYALENPDDWVVIDTRSTGEFNGEQTGSSAGAFGTGRMKGTTHINWTRAVNPETRLLRSVQELEDIYLEAIAGRNVIVFCQSGVRSAHTMHVLTHVLGIDNVYNYDGSWIEWSFAASSASGNDFAHILELTEVWEDNGEAL